MKKIGYIFGKRVKGDLELGNAIGLNRAGFQLTAGRKLTNVEQWPTERAAIQRYDIGTRLALGDRLFRYGHIGVSGGYGITDQPTQVRMGYGVSSSIWAGTDESNVTGAVAAEGDVTIEYVTLGAIPAGRFNGGYISIWNGAFNVSSRILNQPIAVGGGATIVLALEDPLPLGVPGGSLAAIYVSPYYNIVSPAQAAIEAIAGPNYNRQSFLGTPLVNGLADEYIWVQTDGPAFMVSGAGTEGTNEHERQLVWDAGDGSVQLVGGEYALNRSWQYAGYIIPATNSAVALPAVGVPGGVYGLYMMLQGQA